MLELRSPGHAPAPGARRADSRVPSGRVQLDELWVSTEVSGVAGGVRNGLSYVMFDNVAFHRTDTKGLRADQGDTGKVQVLLFDVKDRDLIGYMRPNLNIRQYCCTEDLAKEAQGTK